MEVCKKLGIKPVGFTSEIPSDQEIQKFDSYLKEQENEKVNIFYHFLNTENYEIKKCWPNADVSLRSHHSK